VNEHPAFAQRYGPWAVVLGASEGLGAAFAHEAAARGCGVLIAARRAPELDAVAAAIAGAHGVEARTLTIDLAADDFANRLRAAVEDLDVGLVVYNAALGRTGPFRDQSLATQLTMLDVNCRGPLLALDALLPGLIARGHGGVVIMSSATGVVGSAGAAVYGATKAFDLSLGEALFTELAPLGIDVLSVIGPAIDTPNFRADGPDPDKLPNPPMDPADVAREVYDELGTVPSMIPGDANRQGLEVLMSLPRAKQVELMARVDMTKD
jgi:short-subunit dehydrogenase